MFANLLIATQDMIIEGSWYFLDGRVHNSTTNEYNGYGRRKGYKSFAESHEKGILDLKVK